MRKITKIEPTVPELPRRKRVAAYARVSMETDRLMHSLTAQISHYSELIQKNPAWEYAGVYADNFVSGTDTKKRDNFQRMLADCEKGLIDIILCTHEAIIDMETFQYVQEEMRRRKALGPLTNKALNTTCFTGKIKCPFCNVSYMHSIRRDRGFMEFWGCGTNKKKGSRCPVKGTINHKHMIETCVKVLGLAEFDEEIFLDNIDYIAVPARETLEFHMKDGRIITEECKNTGHQDCWTSEYRAKTSEKRRNNIPHNKKGVSCFTTRIKCMNCGSNYRRQKGQSQVIHWRCGNQCGAISLRLDLLEKMCADVLSLEEFNEDVFQEKIQHINVKDSTLIFVFKDGHSEEYIWEKPPKVGHKWSEEQREKYRISIAKSWTPERRAATSKQIKELRRREKLAKNNKNSGNAE